MMELPLYKMLVTYKNTEYAARFGIESVGGPIGGSVV